jgi:hypothetical protein
MRNNNATISHPLTQPRQLPFPRNETDANFLLRLIITRIGIVGGT